MRHAAILVPLSAEPVWEHGPKRRTRGAPNDNLARAQGDNNVS
jgi:hypothetical protein